MVRDICNSVRVRLLQSACYAPLLPYMSRSDTACAVAELTHEQRKALRDFVRARIGGTRQVAQRNWRAALAIKKRRSNGGRAWLQRASGAAGTWPMRCSCTPLFTSSCMVQSAWPSTGRSKGTSICSRSRLLSDGGRRRLLAGRRRDRGERPEAADVKTGRHPACPDARDP